MARRRLQDILDSLLDEYPPPAPPAKTTRTWTEREHSLLVSNYLEGLTDQELAEVTGRKIDEVQDRLFELGRGRAVPDHLRPPAWWFERPWSGTKDEEAKRKKLGLARWAYREQVNEVFNSLGFEPQPLCDRVVGHQHSYRTQKHWYSGEIDAIPDRYPTREKEEAMEILRQEDEKAREAKRSERRWREAYGDYKYDERLPEAPDVHGTADHGEV
jgi:hypothetical protein